jgi:hypothetical protein
MNSKYLLFILATFALPSYAYFDPGTGAYLVQGLIALFAAVVFYLRHPVEFMKKLLKDLKDKIKK